MQAGSINRLWPRCKQGGCTSLGLSGPDGGVVRAKKRNPIPVDYGFVGDIEAVNGKALAQLIEAGYAPIFAPITADASGQLLNTNADTMAQAIAIALSDFFQVKLVYCFEKPGVLRDPQDDHSVIPSINASYFEELKANGTVTAGMIPKLENALKAISKGVHLVRLCLADHLMNENLGTNILP